MEKAVLTTRELALGYKKPALRVASNISLALHRGKLTALCGANGTGKSTLLRTIAGLQPSLSGIIELDSKPLQSLDAEARARHISLVLTQKPMGGLTVRELVAIGRQPHTNWLGTLNDHDRDRIAHAMNRTGIANLANRMCRELSDGQLQLAMIARALAQETPVMLLDEPTTHLDLPNKFELLALLRRLAQDENRCVLFSTHDIERALGFCNDMILMADGWACQEEVGDMVKVGALDKLFAHRGVGFDANQQKFVYRTQVK